MSSYTQPVSFDGAEFMGDGLVFFNEAEFMGDGLVSFDGVKFSGEGNVHFTGANITADGSVSFSDVEVSGNSHVSFWSAVFSGEGTVSFGARFGGEGNVHFTGANFTGDVDVDFEGAEFLTDGKVDFRHAEVSGDGKVDFGGAEFSGDGDVDFRGLDFSGVLLRGAAFSGIDLRDANLNGVDLRGTKLIRSDLRETNLSDTKMDGGTQFGRQRAHVTELSHLRTAVRQRIRRYRDGRSGHEGLDKGDWDAIARGYHALKSQYSNHGLVREARHHYLLERDARGREALASGDRFGYAGSVASRLLTGYGVDYRRVLLIMLLLFIPSTIAYWYWGIPEYDGITGSIYYSVVTFTTSPPNTAPPGGILEVIAMFETFFGTLLVVLLGYVLGNRESF